MNISSQLNAWQGKSTDELLAIYHSYSDKSELTSALLGLIGELRGTEQTALTWLLKYAWQQGVAVLPGQADSIYSNLFNLRSWQSKLHILQSIEYLVSEQPNYEALERFLRQNLECDNKFVRAWSYDAWYWLCQRQPSLRSEVEDFLTMALRDEAPSVKARVRKLQAKLAK